MWLSFFLMIIEQFMPQISSNDETRGPGGWNSVPEGALAGWIGLINPAQAAAICGGTGDSVLSVVRFAAAPYIPRGIKAPSL